MKQHKPPDDYRQIDYEPKRLQPTSAGSAAFVTCADWMALAVWMAFLTLIYLAALLGIVHVTGCPPMSRISADALIVIAAFVALCVIWGIVGALILETMP